MNGKVVNPQTLKNPRKAIITTHNILPKNFVHNTKSIAFFYSLPKTIERNKHNKKNIK